MHMDILVDMGIMETLVKETMATQRTVTVHIGRTIEMKTNTTTTTIPPPATTVIPTRCISINTIGLAITILLFITTTDLVMFTIATTTCIMTLTGKSTSLIVVAAGQ
jgi:hypothetical protein